MRVIAGRLRGRPLADPGKGVFDIRPTSDRAREALFSILQKWPTGPFLDLFAGTGAVAVEAWSRGYGPVTAVERSAPAMDLMKVNSRDTDVRCLKADACRLKPDAYSDLSVVFSDPPYHDSKLFWVQLAPLIRPWMDMQGILVWETEQRDDLMPVAGWQKVDERRYGRARLHFMEPC